MPIAGSSFIARNGGGGSFGAPGPVERTTGAAPPAFGSSWEDMEYAGGLKLCGLPDGVVVKNTFIDYPAAREDDDDVLFQVAERGWKSCPPEALLEQPEEQKRPASETQSSVIFEAGHVSDPDESSQTSTTTEEETERPTFLLLNHLPRPEPVFSEGSIPHQLGQQCRPCGFVHKPEGCGNGASCQYCHLCPPGEIKQRRKTKKVVMRKVAAFAYSQRQQGSCVLTDYNNGDPTKVSI